MLQSGSIGWVLRAIERGVSEERIARALDINVPAARRKVRMLDGICEVVVNLLKDKPCPMVIFEVLREMKPLRQIEAAELSTNARKLTESCTLWDLGTNC